MEKIIPLPVPVGGERGDLVPYEIPPNAMRKCQNMFRSDTGTLILRPGYKVSIGTQPGTRIMGAWYFRTASAAEKTVAMTLTGWWQHDGANWVDISGTALAGSTTNIGRFAVFPQSGTYRLIGVNGQGADNYWDGAAGTYSALGGSPSVAVDVKVSANRVLLLVKPNTIQISDFNNSDLWPYTVTLPDSGDIMIGMERIGRAAVGVVGDSSQWVGRAQTGSFPFRFERVDEKPGTLSAATMLSDGLAIYYLGEDGIIYRFDSVGVSVASEAMSRYVINNLDYTNRGMAHGFYNRTYRIFVWLFPSVGSGVPNLGIYYDLRTGAMGRVVFAGAITASAGWKTVTTLSWQDLSAYTWDTIGVDFPTWDSFGRKGEKKELLGDSLGNVHVFGQGNGSDNGSAVEAIWEHGLFPAGGLDKDFIPQTFETLFKQTANSTTLELSLLTSKTLMAEPTQSENVNIDLSIDQRNDVDLSRLAQPDGETRFVGLRHRISTQLGPVEWYGGLLHGESTEIEKGPTNEDS